MRGGCGTVCRPLRDWVGALGRTLTLPVVRAGVGGPARRDTGALTCRLRGRGCPPGGGCPWGRGRPGGGGGGGREGG